ncbi:MAG: zinc-binding dehydrogenase [Bacteroidota bacterium]
MYAKTAVFQKPDQPLELVDLAIPTLKAGETLVRNEYCTLCKSDLLTYSGKRKEKCPTILGHEVVGRIVNFGPEHSKEDIVGNKLGIGSRISWAIFASDPHDSLSKEGIPQKASDLIKYGHEYLKEDHSLHGGLSQYTIIRKNTPLVAISESIPSSVAAIINCSVATISGAYRIMGPVWGKNLFISGAGMLGVVAIAMGKVLGAKKITVADLSEERLEIAARFGADAGFLANEELSENVSYFFGKEKPLDIALDLSGNPKMMEESLSMLGIGGKAIWLGAAFPQRDLKINAEYVLRNILTIKGLHNYNLEDFKAACLFMERYHDKFPFESLIYDGFDLLEIEKAFQYALEAKPFRVGIRL